MGEYTGTRGLEGKGSRAAYLLTMQAAGDTAKHALIEGNAKPGNVIRLKKSFVTSKHDPRFLTTAGAPKGERILIGDNLDTSLVVPASGKSPRCPAGARPTRPTSSSAIPGARGRRAGAARVQADGDETAIVEKPIPGRYVYRVVNWLAGRTDLGRDGRVVQGRRNRRPGRGSSSPGR